MGGGNADALTVHFRVLDTCKKEDSICWYKFEVESGGAGEQEKPVELSLFMEINQATESAIVYLDPHIYCIGGLYYCKKAKTKMPSNRVYRLLRFHKTGQGSKHGWEKVRNMKKFRQRPQAVSINGKIYVMGGLYPKQEFKQKDFGDDWAEVYDPDTGEWNHVDIKNHETDMVNWFSSFSSASGESSRSQSPVNVRHEGNMVKRVCSLSSMFGESSYSRNPVEVKRESHTFKRIRSTSSGFGDLSCSWLTNADTSHSVKRDVEVDLEDQAFMSIISKERHLQAEKKKPRTVYEFLNSSNDHYDYSCLTIEGYDPEHILLATNYDHYYLYNTKISSMVKFEKRGVCSLGPLGSSFVDRQTHYEIDWDSGLVSGYDLVNDVTLTSRIPFFDGLSRSSDEVGMSIFLKVNPSTNDTPMQVHVIWFGDCLPKGNQLLHYRNISYSRPEGTTTTFLQQENRRPEETIFLQQKVKCTKSFILPSATYLLDGSGAVSSNIPFVLLLV